MSNPRVRLLVFFSLAALVYLMLVFGGGKKSKKPGLAEAERIMEKPEDNITFGDVMAVLKAYSSMNGTERASFERFMEKLRRVYVGLWQAELERRRRSGEEGEYYRVSLKGRDIFLSGNFSESEINSFRESKGWLGNLKLMGFKSLVFEGKNATIELR